MEVYDCDCWPPSGAAVKPGSPVPICRSCGKTLQLRPKGEPSHYAVKAAKEAAKRPIIEE
jgi:hypothetical protein